MQLKQNIEKKLDLIKKKMKKLLHIHIYHIDYSMSLFASRYNDGSYYYRCECGDNFNSKYEVEEGIKGRPI